MKKKVSNPSLPSELFDAEPELETALLPITLNKNSVEELAIQGVPMKTIADIFQISQADFKAKYGKVYDSNRAKAAALNRMQLLQSAQKGQTNAQVYLDKILSGEYETINLSIDRPLKSVPTEELLKKLNG
jgi:hypothetical protein